MSDREPRDPTVGLPSWPSPTARSNRQPSEVAQVSSRQAERDAHVDDPPGPVHGRLPVLDVAGARHAELLAELKRIGGLLLEMSRQPRSF